MISHFIALILNPFAINLNVFSAYVFTRANLNQTTMGFLYMIQFIVDTFFLIWQSFVSFSFKIFHIDIYLFTNDSCRISTFIKNFVPMISSWVMVYIAYDRFVFVYFQARFIQMRKRNFLTISIFVMFLIIACINLEKLFYYELEEQLHGKMPIESNNSRLNYSCRPNMLTSIQSESIYAFMKCIIPILIVVILNLITANQLFRSKKTTVVRQEKKEMQFTLSSIFSNLAYLVLNMPLFIGYLVKTSQDHPGDKIELFVDISTQLSTFYPTFEFAIAMIVNRVFREEVFIIYQGQLRPDNTEIVIIEENILQEAPKIKNESHASNLINKTSANTLNLNNGQIWQKKTDLNLNQKDNPVKQLEASTNQNRAKSFMIDIPLSPYLSRASVVGTSFLNGFSASLMSNYPQQNRINNNNESLEIQLQNLSVSASNRSNRNSIRSFNARS
jgi:hypothetical protein